MSLEHTHPLLQQSVKDLYGRNWELCHLKLAPLLMAWLQMSSEYVKMVQQQLPMALQRMSLEPSLYAREQLVAL